MVALMVESENNWRTVADYLGVVMRRKEEDERHVNVNLRDEIRRGLRQRREAKNSKSSLQQDIEKQLEELENRVAALTDYTRDLSEKNHHLSRNLIKDQNIKEELAQAEEEKVGDLKNCKNYKPRIKESITNKKHIYILGVYRPSSASVNHTFANMTTLLNRIPHDNSGICLVGDLNIDSLRQFKERKVGS
ncbi:hypothetical protein J6590_009574 [Homalodisca vitripennis]|nr:hypothetical protein J6590_009574 [Homalodisca vitripennis]